MKDISKYTNLLMTIPSLWEKRYFDPLNTIKKVDIPISWSLGNFCFTHESIVEPFKQERVTLLQWKISKIYYFSYDDSKSQQKTTFWYTKYIHQSLILISWCSENLNFSRGSIGEHCKEESVTFYNQRYVEIY